MDSQLEIYWAKSLNILKKSQTTVVFDNWINTLKPLYIRDNILYIQAKDDFAKTTIEGRYLSNISDSFKAVSNNKNIDISIVTDSDFDNKSVLEKASPSFNAHFKAKYVFETFVRGKSNELAYAAAVAVAESSGTTTYNPLFLYGGVGLGKTHLMHSIGNHILSKTPDKKVMYISTETFTNELINSIKERKNQEFRNKYREIDVLLIDDIQFLTNKESTQEEFFHTFNTLYDAGKQIVISSDQPPKDIKTLEERLTTRFGWGLVVDIIQPDYETRVAILEKKLELDHINVPLDVIRHIAKSIASNIRDLEGAMNKVTAYAKLTNTEMTISLAEKAIQDFVNQDARPTITVEFIQEVVASHYNLSVQELCSKKRSQNIAYPRQIAMYLTRKLLDKSLPKIGSHFGGMHHSTVIHGCDKISDELDSNPDLADTLIEIEKKITGV